METMPNCPSIEGCMEDRTEESERDRWPPVWYSQRVDARTERNFDDRTFVTVVMTAGLISTAIGVWLAFF
jgi:hypothetical protein